MRSRWMAVVLGVGLVAASRLPAAAAPLVMRVATPTTNDPQVYEMQLFKKAVEESSRGQIQVQLFPSSQLGSNAQMLQMLRAGSIQGLLEPTAFLGGFDNVMTVVDIPYLFRDVQQAVTILNGPLGNPLREHLERTGLVALGFYEYGPRIMLLKFPVRTLEDLRGKKIRVMGAQVLVDQMNAWGATGIAMGVPELFNALQQGTIDGLESAAMFFYSGRYYELARYLFMAPRGAEVTVFLSNKRWLEGLPEELRRVVVAVGAGITEEANRFARQSDAQALENMQKAGVTVLEPSPALDSELRARARAVGGLERDQQARLLVVEVLGWERVQLRSFIRAPALVKVRCRLVDPQKKAPWFTAETRDVGGGGLLLWLPKPLDPGTRLEMVLELPQRAVRAVGEVVRVVEQPANSASGSGAGVAVQFVDIAESDRDRIIGFVLRRQAEIRRLQGQ